MCRFVERGDFLHFVCESFLENLRSVFFFLFITEIAVSRPLPFSALRQGQSFSSRAGAGGRSPYPTPPLRYSRPKFRGVFVFSCVVVA